MFAKQKRIRLIVFILSLFFVIPLMASAYIFNNNLKLKDVNNDVKELQKYFNANNFRLAEFGPGSSGQEINAFGPATRNSLLKFQKANNLPETGFFGPLTRAVINKNEEKIVETKSVVIYKTPATKVPQVIKQSSIAQVNNYSINGSITGLSYSVTIQKNGKDLITINPGDNSNFVLPAVFTDINNPDVTIKSGSFIQSCYLQNNSANNNSGQYLKIACGVNLYYNPFTYVFHGGTANFTLTYSAEANGTISGVANQSISSGSNGSSVTALANSGYHFTTWSDGILTATRTDTSVNDNKSVTATFVINETQSTPAFSVASGAVTFPTNVTISATGSEAIYYTIDGSDPTTTSTNQATTPLVINSAITVKALAVRTNYNNSSIASSSYTQSLATAPSAATLAVGSVNPVQGVKAVAIPASGATDTSGSITGWVTGTKDKIKFTVTDSGSASSTIAINSVNYSNGTNYTVTPGSPLSVVVTTTETGKATSTRTFSLSTSFYPPAQSDTYVKATTKADTNYWPYYATTPGTVMTGSYANNSTWMTNWGG